MDFLRIRNLFAEPNISKDKDSEAKNFTGFVLRERNNQISVTRESSNQDALYEKEKEM